MNSRDKYTNLKIAKKVLYSVLVYFIHQLDPRIDPRLQRQRSSMRIDQRQGRRVTVRISKLEDGYINKSLSKYNL